MRLILAAAACLAVATALAQGADPERDASRPAPRQSESRAGTVTNPPAPSGAGRAASRAGEPGAPAARAPERETPHADGAVKQQAEAKRRGELEHCQTLNGESRADCIRRAEAEYRRATSDDTLSGERAPGAPLG
jgi:hypothetical protein